ncbi:MAG: Regulatory protein RepA [Planctomycetes bacterium ADurb.Bin126]|nr:MAG: Regulatory protein RepA [Planctomycetes bacterium ADurb.Bin126]
MVATRQDTIPQGQYDARIVRSLFTGHSLFLEFAIIGGEHDGHIIVKPLRLHSSDANTQQEARAELCQICRAVGVMAPKDSSELYNIPMTIHVGVDKRRNTILTYSSSRKQHASPSPGPRRLQLTRADQIEMRPPDWLLRGMLERDTFALIFGDPGCGKSLLAIDWACRIATGTPWRGHPVKAGPVVYIAGEGQQGFGRRIRAWEKHNDVSLADAPLYVAPAVAIPDVSQVAELLTALGLLDEPPALIVLDTLARCFGGGDENSTQDMSKFVSACDAIRQRYGCTILVVHHAGHADKSRARGAIALKAALDAEYRLAKDGGLLLTATKMKDAEMPAPVAMELVTVELPGIVDDYGNPVTSAAVEMIDADTGAIVSKAKTIRPRGKWQDVGFAVARRLIAASEDGQVSIDAWRDGCQAAGMVRQNQHRVLEGLVSRGDLAMRDGALSIIPT